MIAALSPDPAGVTLTVEEIVREICAKMQDDHGRLSAKPEWISEAATAILSLIQKSVQPRIDTKPATSGTAAPVCETAFAKRCYAMTEPHLSGYRMVIGFTSLADAQDAQQALANITKGKP